MKELALIPRVSEKAYAISQVEGIKTYVFEVPLETNKHTVARAVNSQYDVVVTSVRTATTKGKPKTSYRKRGRPISGSRGDVKKAYVTLREGDTLPLFIEEAKEEAATAKPSKKEKK